MLEKEIEGLARKRLAALGGKLYKTVSPGCNGFPDRMAAHAGAGVWFMEFKAPGKKASPLQRAIGNELAEMGQRVYLDVDSVKKAYEIIDDEVHQRERRHPICTGLNL